MLSSRGIHGLVERTVVPRRASSLHFHGAPEKLARLSSQPYAFQVAVRLASTSTRQATANKDAPPSTSPSRKPKVELRPGPIKPPPATASPPAPPPQAAVTNANAEKAQESAAGKAVEQMSTIETMKFDVKDAMRRGIMTPPPADAGKLGNVWHQMKEVFKFYFRGVKQINAHRIMVRDIKRRVREGGEPVTRAETRFIRVYREDVLKLVPFVLIALVLEEVIPLLVLYAPFMLPSTCVLPSQAERITRKAREKQIVFTALREFFDEPARMGAETQALTLKDLHGPGLQAMCGLLGLSTWGPPNFRRARLTRTMRYLAADDAQLRAEEQGARLTEEELAQALQERGIMTEMVPRAEWGSRLRWWLKKADVDEGVDAIARRAWLVATIGAHGKPSVPFA